MKYLFLSLIVTISLVSSAQQRYELNSGWKCAPVSTVKDAGSVLSMPSYATTDWLPATVPGTVLTTQLNNGLIPDPFYGMNNKNIPDIYHTGRDYYTYWFVKEFKEQAKAGEQVWLQFRGINYSCDVFLNGQKLTKTPHTGMFLRKTFNITSFLNKNGNNRIAVIVYPPNPVGNPNGGQGGDGTIAKNVAHQYVAGWDWIQPIRDRNTGIWDKVLIEKTGSVQVKNPHVVTLVPGKRLPNGPQQPAILNISAELENPTNARITGTLQYSIDGKTVSKTVTVSPRTTVTVALPSHTVQQPKLWWPHGYGPQHLYPVSIRFLTGKTVSDEEQIQVGIREIQTDWNDKTRSKQVSVNGQRVFIKGGNWIISDQMLRFSPGRYDAEIRFHRDMNLNLIRIWGGAITERPEFYEACDRYGLLVMQDFWGSGDCNGRWVDPAKLEDQWTRRNYPDDHSLFLESAADQIKMIRNYPSLAIWCGGNEITLPEDIMLPLRDSLLPALDGTRWFIDYSNSDDMSYNFLGGNGDGPYGIQPIEKFWSYRTWPFNSEVGSVGTGDYESLERFIPKENLIAPVYAPGRGNSKVDSVWEYHKYIGYDQSIDPYGKATDARDFGKKAQLVNYDQYRALMEGFSSHMWDWYTGTIIWKTQNPWTALRGQMYDYYLDPNACLYGLQNGGEPLHIMYNPADSMVMVANHTFQTHRDLMMVVKLYDMEGKERTLTQVFSEIGPSNARPYLSVSRAIQAAAREKGVFLSLRLLNLKKETVSENLYWIANAQGMHTGLQALKKASIQTSVRSLGTGKLEVTLRNPAGQPVAFFNRLALVNPQTGKRILPVFYSTNYVSVLPGEQTSVILDYPANEKPQVWLEGWNVPEQRLSIP